MVTFSYHSKYISIVNLGKIEEDMEDKTETVS